MENEIDIVIVNEKQFPIALAVSAQEQERGLMFQKEAYNLAFPYLNRPAFNSFWMKNTNLDLDIIFCLKNKVMAIHRGEPNSLRVVGGDVLSDLVIELPFGTCKNNGIVVGSIISMQLTSKSKMRLFSHLNYV